MNEKEIPKDGSNANGVWLKAISVAAMTIATLVGATYANRTFLDPRPDAITKSEVEVIRLQLELDFDRKIRAVYQVLSEQRRKLEDADREIQQDKPPTFTKERIKLLERAMEKLVPDYEHPDEWGSK